MSGEHEGQRLRVDLQSVIKQLAGSEIRVQKSNQIFTS
jgi:hypothetical protein